MSDLDPILSLTDQLTVKIVRASQPGDTVFIECSERLSLDGLHRLSVLTGELHKRTGLNIVILEASWVGTDVTACGHLTCPRPTTDNISPWAIRLEEVQKVGWRVINTAIRTHVCGSEKEYIFLLERER